MKRSIILLSTLCLCGLLFGCETNGQPKESQPVQNTAEIEEIRQNSEETPAENMTPIPEQTAEEITVEETTDETPVESIQDASTELRYMPTEEILNSPLSSGVVQIGNDFFKVGGFLTVEQFISEYSDKYDVSELEQDSMVRKGGYGTAKISALSDSELSIKVSYILPIDYPGDNSMYKLGECIVTNVEPSSLDTKMWFNGYIMRNGEGLDYYNTQELLDSLGYVKATSDNLKEFNKKTGFYYERPGTDYRYNIIELTEKSEELNLTGHYTLYSYIFSVSTETSEIHTVYVDIHLNGDDWSPIE